MLYGHPYCAKAIIEHQYLAGTLRIWITYDFPMNQKHKPADTVWIVKIDGDVTAITSSAWQDSYTMLLTITDLEQFCEEVLVKFDGPDGLLETTWLKNWEPWGYILSIDITSGGLSTTVPLAKLTIGGTDGQLLFVAGRLIGKTDPT